MLNVELGQRIHYSPASDYRSTILILKCFSHHINIKHVSAQWNMCLYWSESESELYAMNGV